jgi:hypothetical protein
VRRKVAQTNHGFHSAAEPQLKAGKDCSRR